MRKNLFYIAILLALVFSSCDLFKSSQHSDETPIEIVPDEEMTADESVIEEPIDTVEIIEIELPEIFLTYERTYCFGMCPVFKSTIFNSGRVEYKGINFVDNMGMHYSQLTDNEFESIRNRVEEVNYFSLDSLYDNPHITDLPSVITLVNHKGESHGITDRWQSPKELKTLYKILDDTFKTLEWESGIE